MSTDTCYIPIHLHPFVPEGNSGFKIILTDRQVPCVMAVAFEGGVCNAEG